MAIVEFANTAIADLDEIDDYSIAQFGEKPAISYMEGFDQAFAQLADFPKSGRPLPEIGKGIRCLTHRCHRIFYRLETKTSEDIVLIIRIIHHAMRTGGIISE